MKLIRNFAITATASVLLSGGAYAGGSKASLSSDDAKVASETLTCISLSQLKTTNAVDDSTILFELRNGEVFSNNLGGSCVSLARNKRFSFKTTQNQICNGDIITTTNSVGMEMGSCGLGQFELVAAN